MLLKLAVSHHICTTLACTPSADSCVLQLAGSAAKQLVRGVAALDLQLENAGILNQLEAKELPEDVITDEGEEMSDAVDVRMLPPGPCDAAVPPWWSALLLPCPGHCFASPFPALMLIVQQPGCCKLCLAALPRGDTAKRPKHPCSTSSKLWALPCGANACTTNASA